MDFSGSGCELMMDSGKIRNKSLASIHGLKFVDDLSNH
jgi:hypothetical protein